MCLVCGPGGSRFLQAVAERFGGASRGGSRFVAEEITPETTPPLDPTDLEDLQGPADLILRGGPILTMRRPDEAAPAIALRSGRIQRLGGEDEVMSLRGRLTRVVDLDGRTVTPGFVNAHWHPPLTLLCDWLEWEGPASSDAVSAAMRRDAGEWLVLRCPATDASAREAAKGVLARADRPAVLIDPDGVVAHANDAASARPGFAESFAAAKGAPAHVSLLMPMFAERLSVSREPLEARLRRVLEDLARGGFTTVRFCGLGGLTGDGDVELVRSVLNGPNLLRLRGALDMRLLAGPAEAARAAGFGDDTFRVDAVTGWIVEGETDVSEVVRQARELRSRGWRITLHADGDASLRAAVAGFATMAEGATPLSAADGLECRLRDGASAAALAAGRGFSLGLTDGEPLEGDAGSAIRSVEASGTPFTVTLDRIAGVATPFEILDHAGGKGRERAVMSDRLDIVTVSAARRCGADAILGVLDVGRYADLAFLDVDPRATPAGGSRAVRCLATWVGGREAQARAPDSGRSRAAGGRLV